MKGNFHRPRREAEERWKHRRSCSQVAPTFLKGSRECPPQLLLFFPLVLSLATLTLFPASADNFENCLFSPLLPAKLLSTFLPACRPPRGQQGKLQTLQVQSQVRCLYLLPNLPPSCSSSNVCQPHISNQPVLRFQSYSDFFSWMSFHSSPFSSFLK